jgi:hypothetical protein
MAARAEARSYGASRAARKDLAVTPRRLTVSRTGPLSPRPCPENAHLRSDSPTAGARIHGRPQRLWALRGKPCATR